MKRTGLLIAGLFYASFSVAQTPVGGTAPVKGRISGVIIDSLTKQPLEYATVALGRSGSSKNTNGALTDDKGNFKIDNIVPGTYRLSVSFMGYKTKVVAPVKTTPGKPDNNLGRIMLSPDKNLLNAVVVQGEAPVVENRVDKVVYNAEKDATVSGGNAGDVLRKVPMVSVDQDGNVSLRGSQNVKILINGKPSGAVAASVADAMKMLPADQIKSVEVITSPSAKYDAEGTGGIINIITKKNNMSGVGGSISGGVGTRQNNGNANLNINHNRLSISGNFGGNGSWPQTSTTYFNSQNLEKGTQQLQNGTSRTKRYGYMASGNISYDFNNFNSISTGINVHKGQFQTDGLTQNRMDSIGKTEQYDLNSNTKTQFGGFDWDADYTHKFKKEGHEVSIAGQWSHGANTTDFSSLYSDVITDQTANNDAKNNEYTLQLDYSLPITKSFKLEAGGKTITRKINSGYDFFTPDPANGQFVFNTALSNDYIYNQDVKAGYTVFSFQLPKSIGLQVGARVENTKIDGDANNLNEDLQPFSNSYTNFIPSFAISKTFKNFKTLRLSYSKRIQRPSLQYLNPFRNTSNAAFQRQGNPYLSPEVSQSVELNFSTMVKTSMINASVYFRHTGDVIESFVTPDVYEGRSVSLTTYNNIGNNNSFGASFYGSVTPVKNITLRGNLDLFTYKPAASSSFENLTTQDNTYVQYKAFVSGSYNLPQDFVAETFMILNSPRRTFQGTNPSFSMWVLSFSKQILNKKGKIGLNVIDPFNDSKHFKSDINTGALVQNSDFSIPFRSVGINFSWRFGKMDFSQQQRKKQRGVNNDDLKQGDSSGQGGQAAGGGQ